MAIAVVGALSLGVGHTHLGIGAGCTSAVCIHCGGGAAVQPVEPLALAPVPIKGRDAEETQLAPELRSLLRLDHSGCAPPAS